MQKVGLQLWSVREEMEKDLLGIIEKVAKMGYAGVQFAGFFDYSAEDVKMKIDEVGIKVAGAHVQINELINNVEETLKYHDTIGNELIIIPFLPENMRTTAEDYKRTAKLLNHIGRKIHAAGFTLAYHNHDFEFDMFDGKTGLDILLENTDAEYLKIELDCFWAAYTGNNALEVMEKYANRCVSLHIKDMKVVEGQSVSTEIGTGILPLFDYIQKGMKHSVKWFVVEQEDFVNDPVESARRNAMEIKEILGNIN